MIEKLQNYIQNHLSLLHGKKLLLAVSGGVDSMVLVDIFYKLKFEIAVANCDFQLRGEESHLDSAFVETYCAKNAIPFFVKKFETKEFAEINKTSIQQAAREMRYDWFYELLATEGYDYILTAHHADDNLETFLINLSRGTGLEGLTGIPQQNEKIIRPLLPFSRLEIENHAKENDLQWREDSSNASDKYVRNKIRHHIVPILKEINPNFLASFQKTQNYLQNSSKLIEDVAQTAFKEIVEEKENNLYIHISKLLALTNYKSYLYQWLKKYSFTAWEDIYDLVHAQSGKHILGSTHRILKDREYLLVSPITEVNTPEFYIHDGENTIEFPIILSFCNLDYISEPSKSIIFVDKETLKFPLKIRKWQEGDYFYPSGMTGKKKVSKYFKDEKFSLVAKEKTWLLCSDNQIVWIIGHRPDSRFIANKKTQHLLKIEIH